MNRTCHALFSIFLICVLFSACMDEDPIPATRYTDNGTYNPDSYFPHVNGARWVYETETGDTFSVSCGLHFVDSIKQYQNTYAINYHLFSSSNGIHPTFASEPRLNGKYWMGSIPGNLCVKSGPYSVQFMLGLGVKPGKAFISFVCGSGGPVFEDYIIAVDSSIQIDGYTEVFSNVFAYSPHVKFEFDSIRSTPQESLFSIPLRLKDGSPAPHVKTYYAKGVGVIRKEAFDDKGNMTSFIRLIHSHFPN